MNILIKIIKKKDFYFIYLYKCINLHCSCILIYQVIYLYFIIVHIGRMCWSIYEKDIHHQNETTAR